MGRTRTDVSEQKRNGRLMTSSATCQNGRLLYHDDDGSHTLDPGIPSATCRRLGLDILIVKKRWLSPTERKGRLLTDEKEMLLTAQLVSKQHPPTAIKSALATGWLLTIPDKGSTNSRNPCFTTISSLEPVGQVAGEVCLSGVTGDTTPQALACRTLYPFCKWAEP
jgi:hypothetical protein